MGVLFIALIHLNINGLRRHSELFGVLLGHHEFGLLVALGDRELRFAILAATLEEDWIAAALNSHRMLSLFLF